jgi:nucleotide-binding universal stress UspA family protein
MIALKNILVATDFGEASDAALTYGRALARCFNSTLHVLYVCENVFTRGLGSDAYVAVFPDLQKDVEDTSRKQLEELLTDQDRRDVNAKPVILTSNMPALAIVQYAKDAEIDLIVMGTHGRGAVAHLLMGSVAEKVVRTAPCPVLTVRHPEHDFIVPDTLAAVAHT